MNLFHALIHADQEPRSIAIISKNKEYRYSDLDKLSGRIQSKLKGHGLVPGDRVAFKAQKSPEAIALYLACLRAGLVFLPMNPAFQRDEVRYYLENARPKLAVIDPGFSEEFMGIRDDMSIAFLDADGNGIASEAAKLDPDVEIVERQADDPAVIIYTSGTTGKPKGAVLSHENLIYNGQKLIEEWGFTREDTLLHALPIFHVHGLFFATHCTLLSGARMIFQSKFDTEAVRAAFPKSTVFMGVPTYYTRLLADSSFSKTEIQSIRLFVSGSAPLQETTFEQFEARTGHKILERYGMSETGIISTNPLAGDRRVGTVGAAMPGTEIRIVDDADNRLPSGEVGHIQVKGPSIFKGYWEMPEKNRSEFIDGFFRTGDLGVLSEDGYLRIVGRSKDLIITGGMNVYPKEIESVLDTFDGIQESAVIGLPDPDFGESVTAVYAGNPDLDESSLKTMLKEKLANYKIPKRFIWVDKIPKNAMGKVQKNVLRADLRR